MNLDARRASLFADICYCAASYSLDRRGNKQSPLARVHYAARYPERPVVNSACPSSTGSDMEATLGVSGLVVLGPRTVWKLHRASSNERRVPQVIEGGHQPPLPHDVVRSKSTWGAPKIIQVKAERECRRRGTSHPATRTPSTTGSKRSSMCSSRSCARDAGRCGRDVDDGLVPSLLRPTKSERASQVDQAAKPCSVPKLSCRPVTWRFTAQAIRRYSLITPPRTRFRRIGASSGMTVAGSWLGGRWSRPWCGR